jgi:hypothetical protein
VPCQPCVWAIPAGRFRRVRAFRLPSPGSLSSEIFPSRRSRIGIRPAGVGPATALLVGLAAGAWPAHSADVFGPIPTSATTWTLCDRTTEYGLALSGRHRRRLAGLYFADRLHGFRACCCPRHLTGPSCPPAGRGLGAAASRFIKVLPQHVSNAFWPRHRHALGCWSHRSPGRHLSEAALGRSVGGGAGQGQYAGRWPAGRFGFRWLAETRAGQPPCRRGPAHRCHGRLGFAAVAGWWFVRSWRLYGSFLDTHCYQELATCGPIIVRPNPVAWRDTFPPLGRVRSG